MKLFTAFKIVCKCCGSNQALLLKLVKSVDYGIKKNNLEILNCF